jgi:hypothetical protein
MKLKYLFFSLLALAAFFCSVCSCSTGEAAEQIFGGSSEAPVFLTCKAVSETEIEFQFSCPVRVVSLRLDPAIESLSSEDGSAVKISLSHNPGPGERLTADLLVEDEHGNTINVLVPFRTRNVRIPGLRINELRTEYSKPKAEFIEFKILEEGNLSALRLFIAGNYKNPLVYEFPPVEVGAEEYIVLHLRTMEEACRDETGSDLDASGGTDAVAGARDLWRAGTDKVLHKTDVVYVLDQDDKVVDAIMLSENPDPWWNKEYLAEAADFLFKQGAWKSAAGKIPGPADAVITYNIKTAMTRSICRDETAAPDKTAAEWYICATSGISPGKPNKPARFTP